MMRFILLALSVVFLASCGKDVEGLTPEEYISENNLQATELSDGVYIVVTGQGNSEKPGLENVVDVNYTGRLTDGTVFDNQENFKAILEDLILGWQIGLPEIGVGGSCTLIIPHEMGFGDVQNGPIPAKSTLVFDIELNDFHSTRTVDEYIADNELNTVELSNGIHIVIHEEGNDVKPTLESTVTVNYVGKLTNELVFDQGENTDLDMMNLIQGWQIGLQEIGEGGSCTLVIPSTAAYGSNSAGIIPPNSPLVFEIDLLKVES